MLSNGRPYLAIPGPSVMPDRVIAAMQRPAPNIYTGELHDVTRSLVPDLKSIARTAHDVAIYIGNGHAAWEAALVNACRPGDRVLVLATGRFGHGWAEMAAALGLEVEILDFGLTSPVDPGRVAERLAAPGAEAIRAVLAVHVDTSTSVRSDIAAIRAAMTSAGHEALLMVDCIASLAADRFEMDAWGVDVMVAASQKGLMTPPGLGFVFLGPRAVAARERTEPSRYWDWRMRIAPEQYYQFFAGTAPTHHVYALRAALDMIGEEGIENVWARHETLARAIWAAFDAWGRNGPLALNVTDPQARSHAVTAAHVGAPFGDGLRAWCEEVAGLTLGIGLGREPAEAYFRIGHMGHVSAQMVFGALGSIDAGLKAVGVPHGRGALDAAAEVVATATASRAAARMPAAS